MSPYAITHQILANILSKTYPVEKLQHELRDFQFWEELVKLSSRHLLLPALYWSLNQKQALYLLPEDLQAFLVEIHEINFNRNVALLDQVRSISETLTKNNINHCFIKGTAILMLLEDDHGQRMVGDIDILIAPKQLNHANGLLLKSGYHIGQGFNYQPNGFRHLDRLIHRDYIAAVELHSSILNKKNAHLLNTNGILKESTELYGIRIPTKFHIFLNSLYGFQINDHGYYLNLLPLKSIYDSILLGVPKTSELNELISVQNTVKDYLAKASYLFTDYSEYQSFVLPPKLKKQLAKQLNDPKAFKFKQKWKKIFLNLKLRLIEFSNNPSYRRHVLKNKIFRRLN